MSSHSLTLPIDETYLLELARPQGGVVQVRFPLVAETDATFLISWLHGKAIKTQKAYCADLCKFYFFCGLPLAQVTLRDLQRFEDSLAPLKTATRARTLASIKSAMTFGVKIHYLPFNVGAVVKLPEIENTLAEKIISEQQVTRMFALEENSRNHAILVLLYRAALRAEELANLTWAKLQERSEGGQVAVFGKGSKTRFVRVDQETWEEVMSLHTSDQRPDDYVFKSRQRISRIDRIGDGGRLDTSSILNIVRAAANRAGVKPGLVSPHYMRHAHATHALENGAPITLVQNTLGHKKMETTSRYTHVRPDASSSQYLKV